MLDENVENDGFKDFYVLKIQFLVCYRRCGLYFYAFSRCPDASGERVQCIFAILSHKLITNLICVISNQTIFEQFVYRSYLGYFCWTYSIGFSNILVAFSKKFSIYIKEIAFNLLYFKLFFASYFILFVETGKLLASFQIRGHINGKLARL